MATICMHGLDLSGIKWETPKAVRKKRTSKPKRSSLPSPYFMADIKPFVSPVGDWGPDRDRKQPEVISSRKQKRDHLRAYGLVEAGDLKNGEIVSRGIARKKALEEKAKGVTLEWSA